MSVNISSCGTAPLPFSSAANVQGYAPNAGYGALPYVAGGGAGVGYPMSYASPAALGAQYAQPSYQYAPYGYGAGSGTSNSPFGVTQAAAYAQPYVPRSPTLPGAPYQPSPQFAQYGGSQLALGPAMLPGGGGPGADASGSIAQLQQAVAGLTQLVQQLVVLLQGSAPQQSPAGPPSKGGASCCGSTPGQAPVPAPGPSPAPAPAPNPGQAPAPVPGPGPVQQETPAAPGDWRAEARNAAIRHGIDPNIFSKQIEAESGFDPTAKSPAGAQGIAQIMPSTARAWGVDPMDPKAALDAAAKNMAKYLQKYGGDWPKALAAYNAGEGAVQQHGGVPPYAETQNYIKKILG